MQKKEVNIEKTEQDPENIEKQTEREGQDILESLENRSIKEEQLFNEVKSKTEEDIGDGVLSLLGEKMKKNKLLRATLVALSIYSTSPAFATETDSTLRESSSANSEELFQDKNLAEKLNQIEGLSDFNRKQLEKVYTRASEEKRKTIIDQLKKDNNRDSDFTSSGENNPDFLVLQQQIADLQNSGEMSPRRKGGVVLPFDKEHSGENSSIEYTDDSLADDGGMMKINIENASENQIRAWIDYLKNKKRTEQ